VAIGPWQYAAELVCVWQKVVLNERIKPRVKPEDSK